ncbi:MAG: DUF3014 domain-containing protein [Victivallales bacterium]|nr:DUF3014 domain-containing protein [Victivallales bacterium]
MLARKIFFYLLPPIVVACIIGGIYWTRRHSATPEEGKPTYGIESSANASPPPSSAGAIDSAATAGNGSSHDLGGNADGILDTVITKTVLTAEELLARAPGFSDSAVWAKLLGQTTPVMRIVKAIDAVANGERPVAALDFLRTDTAFTARRNANGEWTPTAETYARYQDIVDFVASIPPQEIAKWFEMAEPVLQQSCRQLGYQDKSIRELLAEAIQTILDVPQFSTDPALVPTGTTGTYHFVDPAFEQLNDAQKLLVRLGPENCAKIQAKCRAIADALNLRHLR